MIWAGPLHLGCGCRAGAPPARRLALDESSPYVLVAAGPVHRLPQYRLPQRRVAAQRERLTRVVACQAGDLMACIADCNRALDTLSVNDDEAAPALPEAALVPYEDAAPAPAPRYAPGLPPSRAVRAGQHRELVDTVLRRVGRRVPEHGRDRREEIGETEEGVGAPTPRRVQPPTTPSRTTTASRPRASKPPLAETGTSPSISATDPSPHAP